MARQGDVLDASGDHRAPPDDRAGAEQVTRVLRERARALAVPVDRSADEQGELHLVAMVGDSRVAIAASRSHHVVAPGPLASLPTAGAAIAGLTAVNGELVPVADLATLLDVQASGGRAAARRLVVVDDASHRLGLLVDGVDELVDLQPGDVVPRQDGAAGSHGAISRLTRDGLFVLDLDAIATDSRLWPPGGAPSEGRTRTSTERRPT